MSASFGGDASSSSRVPLAAYAAADADADAAAHSFTETQMDEYREQDRYLPVSVSSRVQLDKSGWLAGGTLSSSAQTHGFRRARCFLQKHHRAVQVLNSLALDKLDSKCLPDNEGLPAIERKNRQGVEGVPTGVCLGVHLVHREFSLLVFASLKHGAPPPSRESVRFASLPI